MKSDKEKRAERLFVKKEKKRIRNEKIGFRPYDPKPYKREKFNEASN